ncbi:uncharacterized protein LOC143373770 [Andrena cerasifolii]|uniref:uncharacterized protein LOC143373770 n=1 Tax=Andrena cerasifolii TaxID=2819439 RepID=UPI004037C17F
MESERITWKRVRNTVASRMIDLSLVHKLVPCRKLRHRTKAMNAEVKQFRGLKTYSQYVQLKTSILRQMSEDSETDDNVSFSEDDYSILHKSDVSVTNYMRRTSVENTNHVREEVDVIAKNDVQPTVSKKEETKKPKRKSYENMNVGWQEVIKKKGNESTSLSLNKTNGKERVRGSSIYYLRDNVRRRTQEDLNVSNDTGSARNFFEREDSSDQENEAPQNNEASIAEKIEKLRVKTPDSGRVMHNSIIKQEVRGNESQMMGQTNRVTDEISEGSEAMERNSYKSFESQKTLESVKDNLKFVLSDENLGLSQDIKEPCTSTGISLDLNSGSDEAPELKTPVNENRDKFPEIQPSPDGCTNHQPKDSGIDEDTEEEFSEDGKRISRSVKVEADEIYQSTQITSTVLDHEYHSVVEPSLSFFDTDSSEDTDDSDKIDNEHKAAFLVENVNNTEEKENIEDMTLTAVEDVNNTEDKEDIKDTASGPAENVNNVKDEMYIKDKAPSAVGGVNDIKDEMYIEDAAPSPVENANNIEDKEATENMMLTPVRTVEDRREGHENDVPQLRSQPKVTCTEIVKRRFRIISCSDSVSNYCTDVERSTNHFSDEEVLDTTEMDEHAEDSISPLTKKRLQLLRRLNLTIDSESSLSEDEDTSFNLGNIRNKLLKRPSDVSSNEDDDVDFKPVMVRFPKRLKYDNESRMGKHRKEATLYPAKMYRENKRTSEKEKSVQPLKRTESNTSPHKHVSKSPKKELNGITPHCLSSSEDGLKEAISYLRKEGNNSKSSHLGCIENTNLNRSTDEKELNGENLEDGPMVETTNTERRSRPRNLQGFIEEENLVHERAMPSFTYKDIQDDDDIFVLDIPSTVLQSEMVGKRIVLTEKMLKLGKQKYKITYNDVDRVSCVFGTGKSRKPYKTVNIKPIARVVAHQKIFKSSFEKSSD